MRKLFLVVVAAGSFLAWLSFGEQTPVPGLLLMISAIGLVGLIIADKMGKV